MVIISLFLQAIIAVQLSLLPMPINLMYPSNTAYEAIQLPKGLELVDMQYMIEPSTSEYSQLHYRIELKEDESKNIQEAAIIFRDTFSNYIVGSNAIVNKQSTDSKIIIDSYTQFNRKKFSPLFYDFDGLIESIVIQE
ncbi:hypothetical protein OEV98_15470 [Caldibacillus lycopersici]|uniref:Uncharacterized protein n=1 Tax=Perspicuibacillus lycopersici TaxID=1325689 RepID=A0AAE3IX05_9BACI|nr:hypothetical protein [Perspicuibacillus lycopersici]MCU9614944.1 hypothetical protein [Perspicuibacillus lycopersici]